MLIETENELKPVTLRSTQYGTSTSRPQLVSTYNCITPTASESEKAASAAQSSAFTYLLGP